MVETSANAPTSATAADPQPADAKEGRGKPAGEKPAGSKPAGSKPAAKQAGPFAVPEGGTKELVAFVKKVYPIFVRIQDPEVRADARTAILTAAERILAGKPGDQELELAVQIKAAMLGDPRQMADFAAELKKKGQDKYARTVQSMQLFGELVQAASGPPDPAKVKQAVVLGVKFLEQATPQPIDGRLGGLIDQVLWRFGDDPWAEKTYRSLVTVFAASKDKMFAQFTANLQGHLRRFELPGKPITVEGKLLHGEKFDWSMYAGKVVVVYFWATRPDACFRDLPSLEECYELYHAKGFEIVGLSCDQKRADLEAFVKERKIPWAILFDDGKPSPTVEYYSIQLIPRMILVGRNGKVLSLNVRGDKLREELAKLFGPPKETKESPAAKEAGEGARNHPTKRRSNHRPRNNCRLSLRESSAVAAFRSAKGDRKETPVPSPAVQPLLALLACPVGGNPFQYMIEKAFAHHDLDWRCVTFEVGPPDLEDAVRGLRAMGFRGACCAAPHQQAIAGLLDRITDTARAIGAVNCVFREEHTLLGENTDGKGIVRAVAREIDPAGKRVVLLAPARPAVPRRSNWPPPGWPGW